MAFVSPSSFFLLQMYGNDQLLGKTLDKHFLGIEYERVRPSVDFYCGLRPVSLLERFAPLFVLETINTKKEYVGKSNI